MKIRRFVAISLLLFSAYLFDCPPPALSKSERAGLPGRRVGTGTRRDCLQPGSRVVALVPEQNPGLTTQANPTLLFSVPSTPGRKLVEFVIQEEGDRLVYEKTFSIAPEEGVVALNLGKESAQPILSSGKPYRWYFSVLCDPANRALDVVVDGWIQRVDMEPGLGDQLQQASIQEQVEIYTHAQIWIDALGALASVQGNGPEDRAIASHWTTLLQKIGLEQIPTQTLLSLDGNELSD